MFPLDFAQFFYWRNEDCVDLRRKALSSTEEMKKGQILLSRKTHMMCDNRHDSVTKPFYIARWGLSLVRDFLTGVSGSVAASSVYYSYHVRRVRLLLNFGLLCFDVVTVNNVCIVDCSNMCCLSNYMSYFFHFKCRWIV